MITPKSNQSRNAPSRANALLRRFYSDGLAVNIEAIRIHRQILDQRVEDSPKRDEPRGDLADCLRKKFERHGVKGDLHEAISLLQGVL